MTRTSQLQIRISPQEKLTLKRLAGLAGQSVSAYVLSRALPSESSDLVVVLDAFRAGTATATATLAAIQRQLEGLGQAEVGDVLQRIDATELAPIAQNYVAGIAEQLARAAGMEAPAWTARVAALDHPHFRWPLESLRPYQLRATPLALARRNVFDPGVRVDAPGGRSAAAPQPGALQLLSQHLARLELDVEFYFLGGAVLHQVLPRSTGSARPARLFRAARPAADPLGDLARVQGWPEGWHGEAVRQALGAGPGGKSHLELPGLRAWTPPAPYVLAVELAARAEGEPGALDDLRFVLRILDVRSAESALASVTPYVPERYLPSDTRATLGALLAR